MNRKWVDNESYLLFPLAMGVSRLAVPASGATDNVILAVYRGHLWLLWVRRNPCVFRSWQCPELGRTVSGGDPSAARCVQRCR